MRQAAFPWVCKVCFWVTGSLWLVEDLFLGQACSPGHLHIAKSIWNGSVQGATKSVGRDGACCPWCSLDLRVFSPRRFCPQNQIYDVVCNKTIITRLRETFAQAWMLGGFSQNQHTSVDFPHHYLQKFRVSLFPRSAPLLHSNFHTS